MADEMDTPVLDLLTVMTAASLEASSLDPETLMLVRIAALVAVGAPPFSYMANLGVASEMDVDPEKVQGVLTAVAPIVGTTRIAEATGNIVRALAIAIETAEMEEAEWAGGGGSPGLRRTSPGDGCCALWSRTSRGGCAAAWTPWTPPSPTWTTSTMPWTTFSGGALPGRGSPTGAAPLVRRQIRSRRRPWSTAARREAAWSFW